MTRYTMNARTIARVLGGEVTSGQVLFPGPGHSRQDRSACLRLDPAAPGGFVVHSFAGDDPLPIRDHVRERLGLSSPASGPPQRGTEHAVVGGSRRADPVDDAERTAHALALWSEGGRTRAERPLHRTCAGAASSCPRRLRARLFAFTQPAPSRASACLPWSPWCGTWP